jgi:hypothetical protein
MYRQQPGQEHAVSAACDDDNLRDQASPEGTSTLHQQPVLAGHFMAEVPDSHQQHHSCTDRSGEVEPRWPSEQKQQCKQQQQQQQQQDALDEQQQQQQSQLQELQLMLKQLQVENAALKAAQAEADDLRNQVHCMQQAEHLKQVRSKQLQPWQCVKNDQQMVPLYCLARGQELLCCHRQPNLAVWAQAPQDVINTCISGTLSWYGCSTCMIVVCFLTITGCCSCPWRPAAVPLLAASSKATACTKTSNTSRPLRLIQLLWQSATMTPASMQWYCAIALLHCIAVVGI